MFKKLHAKTAFFEFFACLKPVFNNLIANLLKKSLITADILHSG